MSDTFSKFIQNVMPFTGGLIGGPLGERAGKFISKILTGKEGSSQDEINDAISNLSQEKIVELKKADLAYKTKLIEADVDKRRIEASDVENARKRQIFLHDKMPAVLGGVLLLMFFVILLLFMLYPVQSSAKDILEILLGSLAIWCGQTVNFYFGTTHGSMTKTRLLSEK